MWVLSRKGPSGFSASNTAEEVTNGINGIGLTAIVTGASRGIGRETVRVLALRGVHVIMAVRNTITTTPIKEEIIKQIPSAKVDVMELDLSSMASVRKFASDFISLGVPLNILINNAGVNEPNFSLSPDNVQRVFATNHLGHFLLTNLLSETMKNTANQSNIEGRIINVSSEGYRLTYREGIRFDQINDESRYVGMYAYFQSKLANVLHANEIARRLEVDGVQVTANSLHPGSILTDIWMKYSLLKVFATTLGKILLKNVPQGAATTCYVALHPNVKGVSGEYFMDNNISKTNSQAKDAELAKKLWDFSMNLIQNSSSDLVK